MSRESHCMPCLLNTSFSLDCSRCQNRELLASGRGFCWLHRETKVMEMEVKWKVFPYWHTWCCQHKRKIKDKDTREAEKNGERQRSWTDVQKWWQYGLLHCYQEMAVPYFALSGQLPTQCGNFLRKWCGYLQSAPCCHR